ncbi:helix-turn-helix domain-containing protein [Lacticaseibacillus jixiensis]|uniref:helix-turn-helix domain-containing protein n=1 Tax=Lacticaseibacillus jixiensis TaxID=3231926 RepID=UPI0036F1F304
MQIGKQIQKGRERLGMTQDQLADKLYVSRQTISNWGNDRHYPDIENLLMLSVLFDTSLDELVKGDVPAMKRQVFTKESYRNVKLMVGCWILGIILVAPALFLPTPWDFILPGTPLLLSFIPGIRLEYLKRKADVKTFQEILAYENGKDVEALRKHRSWWHDGPQQFGLVLIAALIIGILVLLAGVPYLLIHGRG